MCAVAGTYELFDLFLWAVEQNVHSITHGFNFAYSVYFFLSSIFNYYFRIEIIKAWAYRGAHSANTHTVRNLLFFILFLLFAFFCHRKRFVHFTINAHTQLSTRCVRAKRCTAEGMWAAVAIVAIVRLVSFYYTHIHVCVCTAFICMLNIFFFLFRFSAEHKLRQPTMGFLLFSFFFFYSLPVSFFLSFYNI